MGVDWLQVIREQRDVAMQLARNVPQTLGREDLTQAEASQLYKMVEGNAQDFDEIVESMEEEDLHESLYTAAKHLQDLYAGLSLATATRVRSMQGLPPIEMPDDGDD